MIQSQEETDCAFSNALHLVGEGTFLYGAGNQYRQSALLVLAEGIGDQYDYINWWLYEGAPDYEVSDDTHTWHLKEPEDLYDYITNNSGNANSETSENE